MNGFHFECNFDYDTRKLTLYAINDVTGENISRTLSDGHFKQLFGKFVMEWFSNK